MDGAVSCKRCIPPISPWSWPLASSRSPRTCVPFAYDPLYWEGVFPLGMYSVATYQLTKIVEAPFLMRLSQAFMIIALAAWLATLLGFLETRLKREKRAPPSV